MEDQHYPSAWPNTLHDNLEGQLCVQGSEIPQCLIQNMVIRRLLVPCHNPFSFSSALELGTVFRASAYTGVTLLSLCLSSLHTPKGKAAA